jgi:hypothetical protein
MNVGLSKSTMHFLSASNRMGAFQFVATGEPGAQKGSGSQENGCPFKVVAMQKEGETILMHEERFKERECFSDKTS